MEEDWWNAISSLQEEDIPVGPVKLERPRYNSTKNIDYNLNGDLSFYDGTNIYIDNTAISDQLNYRLITNVVDINSGIVEDVHDACSDGTTFWVNFSGFNNAASGGRLLAYNVSTRNRDPAKDIDFTISFRDFGEIDSDNTNIWFIDNFSESRKARAYNISTKARDSSKDIDLPSSFDDVTFDPTTMWVLNNNIIQAYTISTKARDTSKDINLTTLGIPNTRRIISNGTTIWAHASGSGILRAITISTKALDTAKNINRGRGPTQPYFSIGSDIGIGIKTTDPDSNDFIDIFSGTTGLRVRRIFFSDRYDERSLFYFADTNYIWLQAAIGYLVPFRISNKTKDFTKIIPIESTGRKGISNGTTIWLINRTNNKAEAYDISTKTRDTSKDITLGSGSWNAAITDGTTFWFLDNTTEFARAYNANTRARDSAKDISLGTGSWSAAVSDGVTLWFQESSGARGYTASTRARDTTKDITFRSFSALIAAGAYTSTLFWNAAEGAVSDGTTLWVIGGSRGQDAEATDLPSTRNTAKDINLGTGRWWGATFARETLYFIDDRQDFARAYNVNTRARDSAKDISLGTGVWRSAVTDGTTLWAVDRTTAAAFDLTTRRRVAKTISLLETCEGSASDGVSLWFAGESGIAYGYDLFNVDPT